MTFHRLAALLLVLSLAAPSACATDPISVPDPQPVAEPVSVAVPEPVPDAVAQPAPSEFLVIRPTRITIESPWQVVDILDDDGKFTSNGYQLLRIGADGKLIDSRGVHMMTLERDGTLSAHAKMVAPFVVGARIRPDGTFEIDGEPFYAVGEHGEILAFYKSRGMVATGRAMDGDPAGRRAAMFAWVYLQALERAAAGIKAF